MECGCKIQIFSAKQMFIKRKQFIYLTRIHTSNIRRIWQLPSILVLCFFLKPWWSNVLYYDTYFLPTLIITDRKYRDQVSDQEFSDQAKKLTLSMWLVHQLFEFYLWSAQLCTSADLSFVSAMSVGDWDSGIWQHCPQSEKVMIMLLRH